MSLDDCRELVEAVTDLLEDALPPDEAALARHHLESCQGCATYVDQVRLTVAALRARGRVADDEVEDLEPLLRAFRAATGRRA